ncbi:MAG: S41 family peptidase, partial [Bacteroidia bacterium]
EFEALANRMQTSKKDDLSQFRNDIKQYLEVEIASRYYYEKGKIEQGLKNDPEVKVAIDVLNGAGKVQAILTTVDKPVKPFNPRKRF